MNASLAQRYAELDGLLRATLEVDNHIDLEKLRVVADHPPFDREDLRVPIPAPTPLLDPFPPIRREVAPPSTLFGRKKKLAEAESLADAQYAFEFSQWQSYVATLPAQRAAQAEWHAAAEKDRLEALERETERYNTECFERQRQADDRNADLDELIAGLAYGTADAIEEYIRIVLANSIYPESFSVEHTVKFDQSASELNLRVLIPEPGSIPAIKSYKYSKVGDLISEVRLSQKAMKDRYAEIVNAVALRSLHEVFEADRRTIIESISLEVGTETIDPATGRDTYVPFVAAAVSAEEFAQIQLSAVVPAATLEHLGAMVSKNPFGLSPIRSSGIRRT